MTKTQAQDTLRAVALGVAVPRSQVRRAARLLPALAALAIPALASCSADTAMTYPAPCFPSVEAALAAGDTEDATCATWTTPNGNTVTGPAWAMTPQDVRP